MRKYRFVKDTSVNELKDVLELRRGSDLRWNARLVMVHPPKALLVRTRQAGSAYNFCYRENIETTSRLISKVMLLEYTVICILPT